MPLVPVLNFMPLCSAPGATAIMLSAIIASGNRNPINRSIHTTLYFASTILPRHSADAMTQNPYLFLYSPDPTDAQNWDALYGPEIYARISFHCFAVATRRANPIRRSMTSSEAARWVSIQVSFRPRRCSFYAQKSRLTGGARPPSGCGLTTRIADSSSKNAVSFSSARTTKRFPSRRCASAAKSLNINHRLTPTMRARSGSGNLDDVLGHETLRSLLHIEADAVALAQGLEPLPDDGGMVDEDVRARTGALPSDRCQSH